MQIISVFIFQNSKLEGDAVLFYWPGIPPALSEIVEQAQHMFINFHSRLKLIERDNVCHCEVCQITGELTLKFIAHYGRVDKLNIQKFDKIMGKEVILAHRLLKNHLTSTEYLLLTNKLFNKCIINIVDHRALIKMEDHTEIYKNFGVVPLKYISLASLRATISDPPESLKMTDKTINALSSQGCLT